MAYWSAYLPLLAAFELAVHVFVLHLYPHTCIHMFGEGTCGFFVFCRFRFFIANRKLDGFYCGNVTFGSFWQTIIVASIGFSAFATNGRTAGGTGRQPSPPHTYANVSRTISLSSFLSFSSFYSFFIRKPHKVIFYCHARHSHSMTRVCLCKWNISFRKQNPHSLTHLPFSNWSCGSDIPKVWGEGWWQNTYEIK